MQDPRSVLGVSSNASQDDIKAAYRRAAMEYHPDRNKSPEAEAKFKEIAEAYDSLTKEKDKPLFSMREPRIRGSDTRLEGTIDLKEIFSSFKKEVKFSRSDLCSNCNGNGLRSGGSRTRCKHCSGRGVTTKNHVAGNMMFSETTHCRSCQGVGSTILPSDMCKNCNGNGVTFSDKTIVFNVPAGISEDYVLVERGEGECGRNGGPRGDVFLKLLVNPHHSFERDENDLYSPLKVSFVETCLGGTVKFDHLDGSVIEVKITPETDSGTIFTLEGKGLPNIRNQIRGNLLLKLDIQVPKNLDTKQKELLRKFKEYDEKTN